MPGTIWRTIGGGSCHEGARSSRSLVAVTVHPFSPHLRLKLRIALSMQTMPRKVFLTIPTRVLVCTTRFLSVGITLEALRHYALSKSAHSVCTHRLETSSENCNF